MNILHITTYMQGGAGRIIRDLAVMQTQDEHNVVIVINDKEEAGYESYKEYIDELKKKKIKIYRVDSTFKRNIYLNVEAASEVNDIIKKNNIEIIHSHAATPSMIAMLAKSTINNKKIPIIQTMHGWGTNKNIYHEKMDKDILNLVDRVITVSEADKKLLISKGVVLSKIKTIYNGVSDYDEYRGKYNLNLTEEILKVKEEGAIVLGCIGTVCARKNQRMILEALKFMNDINIKVIFLGEGDQIEKLNDIAIKNKTDKNIKFYGYVDRAYLYIKYFDYTILPSLSEGLPLTILESFREGKPVIVSNIEVCSEIVEDGKNGFVFDVNDSIDLVRVIKKAVNIKYSSEYELISTKCRVDFNHKYRMEEMYKKYMSEYEALENSKV